MSTVYILANGRFLARVVEVMVVDRLYIVFIRAHWRVAPGGVRTTVTFEIAPRRKGPSVSSEGRCLTLWWRVSLAKRLASHIHVARRIALV